MRIGVKKGMWSARKYLKHFSTGVSYVKDFLPDKDKNCDTDKKNRTKQHKCSLFDVCDIDGCRGGIRTKSLVFG